MKNVYTPLEVAIEFICRQHKISQSALSVYLHIPESTLSNLKLGRLEMTGAYANKLAGFTGIPREWWLELGVARVLSPQEEPGLVTIERRRTMLNSYREEIMSKFSSGELGRNDLAEWYGVSYSSMCAAIRRWSRV